MNILWPVQSRLLSKNTLSFPRDLTLQPTGTLHKFTWDLKRVHVVYNSEYFIMPVSKNNFVWHKRHCEFLEKWVFSWRREGGRTEWSVQPDAAGSCQKGESLSEASLELNCPSYLQVRGGCIHFSFPPLIFCYGEAHPLYNSFPPVP